MEFRETLLAAQRNQQSSSSAQNSYYKARFDPPKKEQKQKDRLSANIQKFLAKKDEEERQKKLETQRKKDELLAMRDPKALRKIQKTLKTIKSANKSVIEDAVDHDNTALTLEGPEQPGQDDYGYESQEAAALYAKMMQKYSKIPDEPKFPVGKSTVKKDLNGTRERVKHALQHEDDPVPHKRKRRTHNTADKEQTPPPQKESEKKKDEKPKIRKMMPPPIDFNQLLKLAEQKKSEPIEVAAKKAVKSEPEPERLMTKKQKKEYEEEMARRMRRQERLEGKGGKKPQTDRPMERERKPEPSGSAFGRIPKLGDKATSSKNDVSKHDRDQDRQDRERLEKLQKERERLREKEREFEREIEERERIRLDRERLEKLKAERERIDREMERLSKDKERLDKTKSKLETKTVDRSKIAQSHPNKKSIDLKTQNTYRIDKNAGEQVVSKDNRNSSQCSQSKVVPKGVVPQKESLLHKTLLKKSDDRSPKLNGHTRVDNVKRPVDRSKVSGAGPSRPLPIANTFDFDKHVNSLGKNGGRRPTDVRKQPRPDDKKKARRRLDSESEYDSEMDDFIDDGDENMDYSKHIKEIFGYDKSKYRHLDDDDDPNMESSFVQVQREEYISKKQGIMEDLEDMRMEAMEKAKKSKKKRRISDD